MLQKPVETNEDKSKNCNEMFLMSLLETLDSLSPENAMKARIKIQQILFEIAYEK